MSSLNWDNWKESIIKHLGKLDVILLALLYENDQDGVKGKIFLQKEMFLIINYINEMEDYADFISHFFGPYSEPVEKSLGNLEAYQLVNYKKGKYYITEKGVEVYNRKKDELKEDQIEAIRYFKDFLNNLTRDELLVFIYYSFPEFTDESVWNDNIERKRKEVSKSLYIKGKVSLEKAASLAGMPIEEFIEYVGGKS